MAKLSEDECKDMNMMKFFHREVEDWRSKLIKVYADQHPYTFYVTAGHDFEPMAIKAADSDACVREYRKHKPFEDLKKMCEVDKNAEKDFHELLSSMEKEIPTPELKEALEQKKKECSEVFGMFDRIVSICEEYFELEYSDCNEHVSKQVAFQEPIMKEVEKFLSGVEEFGKSELKSLRERISKWMYDKGLSMLSSINETYNTLNEQPFAVTVWFEKSGALTAKKIRSAFLANQKEVNNLWKETYDDLLMLSAKLEKCRCNYNLVKFKLEREIFRMSRDYKENMPELTKIQKHLTNLIDGKASLKFEIKSLENEIKKEEKEMTDVQNKMHKKILSTRANNKFAHQTALKKFQSVLKTKKEEIYSCLTEILRGDKFIHEEILGVTWKPVDLSHLEPDEYDDRKAEVPVKQEKMKTSFDTPRNSVIADDEFYAAFQVLKTSGNFVTLLNKIADELGFMLDFSWVNYVKEKLDLTQEVKWIELLKVFKINFAEEMKTLEKHMISYCKFDDNGEMFFDMDGAVDGFLNYIWQKRQPSAQNVPPADYDPEEFQKYWLCSKNVIPKTLLWENVENVLLQYLELLEARSNLLKAKLSLITENNDFENYLVNYHKYGTSL